MAIAHALRRLLRILELEEEQAQAVLDAALAQRRNLQKGWDAAVLRDRAGRRLVAASALSNNFIDRLAGLEETAVAKRIAAILRSHLAQADKETARRRAELLAKRVERSQAETLVQEAEAREASKTARRTQRSIDDWYLMRRHRTQATRDQAQPPKS